MSLIQGVLYRRFHYSFILYSSSRSDVDSDEFFDADNELEGRPWPTNQIAEPPSMSIPVDEEDPEDIEEDPGLMETDDTSGESENFVGKLLHVIYVIIMVTSGVHSILGRACTCSNDLNMC